MNVQLVNFVYLFTFVIFMCPIYNEAYRILGIFPFQSRSHQMMFDAIAKGLARKGHQVDVMTVYPLKDPVPNYKVIINLADKQNSLVNQWEVKFASELGDDTLPIIALPFGNGLCEYLGLPKMQEIIKNPPKDPPYDIVLVESFGSHCYIGLGHALNVPVVLVSTTVDSPWLDQCLGQPANNMAFFPTFFLGYHHPLTFLERVHNTITHHMTVYRYRRFTDDVQNAQMRKYIDPNIPPLEELEKKVVLALVNSFYSQQGIRPLTPNLIEVAGVHVYEHYVPLPHDLEKWMNESTAGVVYFTLGSMVNIETFQKDVMQAFYSVFKRLAPVRILMKVADKNKLLPGLPENVRISSWIPQVAVLAHKNTRVFITHGGLMSTQEALTFAVPIIGIPLFGDQPTNIAMYERKNMALKLDYSNLTEVSIYEALDQVLHNPKFRDAAKHESDIFLDRPLSAMETSIFWIEYAIRHGPGSLKSPVLDMAWWQAALLDVYGFIIICIIITLFIFSRIIKFFVNIFFASSTKKTKLA